MQIVLTRDGARIETDSGELIQLCDTVSIVTKKSYPFVYIFPAKTAYNGMYSAVASELELI